MTRSCSIRGSSRRCAACINTGWKTSTPSTRARPGHLSRARQGDETRSACAENFWETLHIDLRMVDTSDFTIAYCPTNIYSVGTAHEIILSRQQMKPVLFVSPPVTFPAFDQLRDHLRRAKGIEALALLEKLVAEVPIKPNPRGIPAFGICR